MPGGLDLIASIAAALVACGVLGALVGAFFQRRNDRDHLAAEWRKRLREQILGPRLDAAQRIYGTLISSGVPADDDIGKLRSNEADILLTDLAPSVVGVIESMGTSFRQYKAFRGSVSVRAQLVFGDEKRFDRWFDREEFREMSYYSQELAVAWSHSEEGRNSRVIESAGLTDPTKGEFKILERDLLAALEIRHDLMTSLQKLMAGIKEALLHVG